MGYYLTFAGNRKANPATGAVPDENYARELMQLFTIGLVRLNLRRHAQPAAAPPVETYTQDDITGLARVFTGWNIANARQHDARPDARCRWSTIPAQHETGAKTFLGTTIPAGTDGPDSLTPRARRDLRPSQRRRRSSRKQLIQHLVTSNPTPGLCRPRSRRCSPTTAAACAAI